MPDNSDTRK